jgi:quercetin dioxygenase-like cupin family protein
MSGNVAWQRWVREELTMSTRRMTICLLVTAVLLATTALMAQMKRTQQTPATTPDHQFLVSLTPQAIKWEPIFEGAEMTVLSGDPTTAGSPYVIRVKHRDGLQVPPHWHSFDEPVTVISGTLVMGLGERYDLSAAQEFPAGSYLVVPKKVPHFAWCKGETIVQGHGIGPLDTHFVRPEDDPRKQTK